MGSAPIGLLTEFKNCEGRRLADNLRHMGRLKRDTDAAGDHGFKELDPGTETDRSYPVVSSTALDQTTRYLVDDLTSWRPIRRLTTDPDGTQTEP